jgi:TP901 family phage tail tape measure protein
MAIEKNVNVIISAQDKFSGPMSALGNSWGTIAKGAIAAEAAIIAASIAAAKFSYDIGKDVLQSAVDFGDAIYDITAVAASFGTTGEDISGILDDLVNRFPVTGKEAGIALETIAQRGFGAKDSLAALGDTALNLTIATGSDLNTAVGALTATMNIFGLEVNDTERLMNLFSAAQFSSAASVDFLNQAMTYAGPIMASAGQDIETTTTVLGILANKGLEASQAGTTLRRSMIQLFKETEGGTEVLKKYGLTYEDVNPATQDFADIIDKLDDQFFTAQDAVKLFGARAVVMGQIINDGAESFRAYRESITNTSAGFDALEEKLKKFDVVMNNLGGSMDIFKKTIGVDLATAIAEFVGYDERSGLRGVVTFLYEMEKAHGGIGDEFVGTFEDVKEILGSAFSDAFPDMTSFYNWLVDIAAAARANIVILTSFFGGVAEGAVSSTKNQETLVAMLELVRISLVSLTVPLALLHDAFVGVYWIAKEAFEGVGGVAAWLDLQIKEMALSMMLSIAKIPIIGNTDYVRNEIARLGSEIVGLKERVKEGFSVEPINFWYDNVLEASARSKGAIEDFSKSAGGSFSAVASYTEVGKKAMEDYALSFAYAGNELAFYEDSTVRYFKQVNEGVDTTRRAIEGLPPATAEFVKYLREAGIEATGTKDGVVQIRGATEETLYTVNQLKTKWEEQQAPIKETKDGVLQIGAATEDADFSMTNLKDGTILLSNSMGKVSGQTITIKDGVISIGEEVDEINKKGIDLNTLTVQQKLDLLKSNMANVSDVIQSMIEWKAKIEIKQLEEDTKRIVTSAETIRDSFVAAADATAAAFGGIGEVSSLHFYEYMEALERQLSIQESLAAAQIAFIGEQTEYFRLRNEAIRRGQATSQVNVAVEGDMEGWLAGLVESLFKDIFVKASAEGFNVLAEG